MSTDTPKTDGVCFDSFEHPLTQQNCEVVKSDFARQLERELAAEKKLSAACSRDCNNTALERNAALDALAAEQEKCKRLREALELSLRYSLSINELEFSAEPHTAIGKVRATLEATK